tara:strand:- start:213 stop:482 length:270 start_codon:yes stop_codon:yes gene_type:complete
MAITKTTTFNYVSSYPAEDSSGAANLNSSHPKLVVVETIVFDDSSDDTLPMGNQIKRWIGKYSDEANSTLTDISSEDTMVQSVAGVIWS